jgi:hypothetical protein
MEIDIEKVYTCRLTRDELRVIHAVFGSMNSDSYNDLEDHEDEWQSIGDAIYEKIEDAFRFHNS